MPVHTSPPDCTPHPCERRRQRRYNDDESGSDRIDLGQGLPIKWVLLSDTEASEAQ